ncbi:hypothetical protein ASY01nite_17800 [Acetobacter syzygii]|nr:hypothetical protein Absy_010_001 [Acetobacter syzygii]GBR65957.1 hypothetical protein AA0483_2099 [Acetobacter syzygii NRIC 0483]GEL56714.1 hypothetical protein ASY01nite_17800 [Acetobacter syzygii]
METKVTGDCVFFATGVEKDLSLTNEATYMQANTSYTHGYTCSVPVAPSNSPLVE